MNELPNTGEVKPVTFELPDSINCAYCEKKIAMSVFYCPECRKPLGIMDIGEFLRRIDKRQIMDVRHGGLVLGRNTPDDDMLMFKFIGPNVLYVSGLMQGMEFIVCPEATASNMGLLEEINQEHGDPDELADTPRPEALNVFNTNLCSPVEGYSEFGGVWVGSQYIINRYATKKHLALLTEINTRR